MERAEAESMLRQILKDAGRAYEQRKEIIGAKWRASRRRQVAKRRSHDQTT